MLIICARVKDIEPSALFQLMSKVQMCYRARSQCKQDQFDVDYFS